MSSMIVYCVLFTPKEKHRKTVVFMAETWRIKWWWKWSPQCWLLPGNFVYKNISNQISCWSLFNCSKNNVKFVRKGYKRHDFCVHPIGCNMLHVATSKAHVSCLEPGTSSAEQALRTSPTWSLGRRPVVRGVLGNQQSNLCLQHHKTLTSGSIGKPYESWFLSDVAYVVCIPSLGNSIQSLTVPISRDC